MGFSLKMFIKDLEETLANTDEYELKLEKLKQVIEDGKQYAKDCGQFN